MKKKRLISGMIVFFVLAGCSAKENGSMKESPLSQQFAKDVSKISDLSNQLEQYNRGGFAEAAGKDAKISVSSLKKAEKTAKEMHKYYYHMPSYQKETKFKKWREELHYEMQQLTEAQGELSVFLNNTDEPTVSSELPSVIHQLNSACAQIQKINKAVTN